MCYVVDRDLARSHFQVHFYCTNDKVVDHRAHVEEIVTHPVECGDDSAGEGEA